MTTFRIIPILSFLPLLLAGCLPAFQQGAPELHDVSLYTAEGGTLYGYFYGEPAELEIGGRVRELSVGAVDDPFSVPATLLIGGAPYLSQPLATLPTPPVTVTRAPYSSDLIVEVQSDVGGVVYFDGARWFTLLEEAAAGYRSRVVPRERLEGLFGLGELTREEAAVFGSALEGETPLVVTALREARAQTRQAGGLGGYRSTALVVQEGIDVAAEPERLERIARGADEGGGTRTGEGTPDDGEAGNGGAGDPQAGALSWEVIAGGAQASGGESLSLEVATSETELEGLWRRAYGDQTSLPPPPELDFGSSSVVAVFLGTRTTGGYSVDVARVGLEDGAVYVDLELTEPAPGGFTTQALTHPWVMAEIGQPGLSEVWFRNAAGGELLGVARSLGGK